MVVLKVYKRAILGWGVSSAGEETADKCEDLTLITEPIWKKVDMVPVVESQH